MVKIKLWGRRFADSFQNFALLQQILQHPHLEMINPIYIQQHSLTTND